jgi:hypothetical protein
VKLERSADTDYTPRATVYAPIDAQLTVVS